MSGIYVFGIVPRHNEERMPAPGSSPPDGDEQDAFDHELVHEPEPYFPADKAESADKQS